MVSPSRTKSSTRVYFGVSRVGLGRTVDDERTALHSKGATLPIVTGSMAGSSGIVRMNSKLGSEMIELQLTFDW